MANKKYVNEIGDRHTHVFRAVLDFNEGDKITGSLQEAVAILQKDKTPVELAGQQRAPLPFTLTKEDLATILPLADIATDEDGKAAFTQGQLNTWAAAIQQGNISVALWRVVMNSMFRYIQRQRDNPPAVPDPRDPPV